MAKSQQELVLRVTTDTAAAKRELVELDKSAARLEDGVAVPVKLTGADKATGDLEAAAAAAQRLDTSLAGVRPTGLDDVGAGAGRTKEQMDTLERSASGTKNAFANLVGNTAQDLGNLAGPLGSVGVALGQVAEYTADAANEGGGLKAALSGAATAAGPMLALAAAGLAVNKVIGDMQKKSAEAKAMNEALRDSFVAGTGVLGEWRSGLEDGADATDMFNESIAKTLDKTGDLEKTATAMGQLNLSLDDMGESVSAADKDFRGWATSLLMAQGFSRDAARDIAEVVSQNDKLSDALAVVNTNAEKNALSKMITPEQKANLDGYVRGLAQFNDLAEKGSIEKRAKETNDLSRASADYIEIVDRGREAGRSELTIMQDVTAEQQRQKEARDANTRATEEGAAAAAESGSILDQVGRQVEDAAERAADAMDKAKDAQDNWLLHEVDYQAGVDDFTESLMKLTEQTKKQKEAGDEGAGSFEGNTKAALDNRDALGDVYTKAVDVIQSMKDAGFSVDGARAAQDNMAQSAYDLAIKMGFPIEKAQEIHDKIANIQPSVTSDIIIAEQGYDEVKAKKDELEKDVEANVWFQGHVDAPLQRAIDQFFNTPGISVSSAPAPAPAPAGLAAAAPVPVAAPMAARSATVEVRPVVNVHVNAGVVADTFQLQRVLERSARSYQRIAGRRAAA